MRSSSSGPSGSRLAKLAFLLPIIASISWGLVGVFVRELSAFGFNTATILFVRQSFAVVLLLIGILIFDRQLLRVRVKDIWIFVMAGLLGVFGLNLCYTIATEELSLSLAAVLLSMFPIFVMAASAILFKEKITKKKISCTALAIFGCALTTGVFEVASPWSASGIGIGLLAAVFYGIYSVISKFATDRGYSALTITFYSFLLVGICLIPFTDWDTIVVFELSAPVKSTIFLILHSLTASVLPYALFTAALKYMDAGKASILGCVEPIAATVFGAIIYAEYPSPMGFIGMLLAIAAVTVLCIPERQQLQSDSENSA